MPTFLLKPIAAPWGDYGDLLFHGMSMHAARLDGKIRLERTGPDIFPITFPIEVVVTDQFRRNFESSGLSGAHFQTVIKHRIVDLDWSSWDLTADNPPELPGLEEPEDYVLERPHSPKAAAAMPNLWELIASEDTRADVYYRPRTKIVALSPRAKAWFESHYPDYVSIQKQG
jgi:hypothetical protein